MAGWYRHPGYPRDLSSGRLRSCPGKEWHARRRPPPLEPLQAGLRPWIVAIAALGTVIVGVSGLFGPDIGVREVLMEVIASFGSDILVLTVFGLLFRSGIERLIPRDG